MDLLKHFRGQSRLRKSLTGLIAVTAIVGGSVGFASVGGAPSRAATTSSPATVKAKPGQSANLWVNAGGGGCKRSSAPAAFAGGSACGSLQAAYNACQPGDTVRISAGSYPAQQVSGSKASPGCVFIADSGTTIASLQLAASWFEIDDATITNYGWNRPNPLPSHVTFRNITTTSEVFMKGGSDISIIGGSIGGFCSNGAPAAMHIEGDVPTGTTISNVLVDRVIFHDITRCPIEDHYEAIRIDGNASFVTIRNSRFERADVNSALIFITNTDTDPGDPHDITIENNFLGGAPNAFYAIDVNSVVQSCVNFKIDYNSFGLSPASLPCAKTNVELVGNVGSKGVSCEDGAVYRSNVWEGPEGVTCSPTDKRVDGPQYSTANLGYADPAAGDFHLKPGSPALGRGEATTGPRADIDGQARPLRVAPDAGADQLESAAIVPGSGLGAIRIGQGQADVRAFYGAPSRVTRAPLGKGGPKVQIDRYRRHGGIVWVAYDAARVVAVGTTSKYYSVPTGLGVGAATTDPKVRPGLGKALCKSSYRRSQGGTVVSLGVGGTTIRSLWITRTKYAGSPAC